MGKSKLGEKEEEDLRKEKNIRLLTIQVDELRRLGAPSSCTQLKLQGVTRSQQTYLDGDGIFLGQPPIKATCTFPDGQVSFGGETIVDDHTVFTFKNETLAQITNIVETSSNCSQSFHFDSTTAYLKHPVTNGHLLHWKDREGNKNI